MSSWAGLHGVEKCLLMFHILSQSATTWEDFRGWPSTDFNYQPHLPVTKVAMTAGFHEQPLQLCVQSEGILPGGLQWNMISYPQRMSPSARGTTSRSPVRRPTPLVHVIVYPQRCFCLFGDMFAGKGNMYLIHWDWFHFLSIKTGGGSRKLFYPYVHLSFKLWTQRDGKVREGWVSDRTRHVNWSLRLCGENGGRAKKRPREMILVAMN